MKNKKLLIICYSFPPSPGIGGRRWAKFAKYIDQSGTDVQVLAAHYEGKEISDWHKDTMALVKEKRVHFFKTGFPKVILSSPSNFYQKIKYHLALNLLKLKIKGNYYDRSALCKNHLLSEVEKFVGNGYKDIIISVGPFMYARHLLSIKKRYPEVKLFLDVRDPWTNNKTAFGYSTLHPNRFNFEKEAENEVIKGFDKIITVADDIGAYFIKEYGISEEKVITIKNGFDSTDFNQLSFNNTTRKTLLFTGNLYEKAENSFLLFVNQLRKMKDENPDFFNHYESHFYGEIHPSFNVYFTPDLNLFFHGRISLEDVFSKIAQSAACLLFLTDDLNYSFSTKFYEYLSQKKPIIVFSKPGKTGTYVEENNCGMQADGSNLPEIVSLIEGNSFYLKNFDIRTFEISNLTRQVLSAIGFANQN